MWVYLKLFEVLFQVFFCNWYWLLFWKKKSKIDLFYNNFATNIGTPAMIIYALNPTNISFEIFKDFFSII